MQETTQHNYLARKLCKEKGNMSHISAKKKPQISLLKPVRRLFISLPGFNLPDYVCTATIVAL